MRAAKTSIPLRRYSKPLTSQEDSFRRLLLVKRFHWAFVKPFLGSSSHPPPIRKFVFLSAYNVNRLELTRKGRKAYTSPYRARPKKRPLVMISHATSQCYEDDLNISLSVDRAGLWQLFE